jgi:hypothetical protein
MISYTLLAILIIWLAIYYKRLSDRITEQDAEIGFYREQKRRLSIEFDLIRYALLEKNYEAIREILHEIDASRGK